jgi:hypothetical protein
MDVPLALTDLDRVLEFIQRIRSLFPVDEIVSSMKLGEVGVSIPEDLPTIRHLIEQFGGVDDLNYIALLIPRQISVEADFAKKSLKVKATSDPAMQNLMAIWDLTRQAQSAEPGST